MYEIIDNTQHINAFHMPQCSTTRPRCCMPVMSPVVFPIAFFLLSRLNYYFQNHVGLTKNPANVPPYIWKIVRIHYVSPYMKIYK